MVRFSIVDPDYTDDVASIENFMISGYTDPTTKEIVLVLINATEDTRSLTEDIRGQQHKIVNNKFVGNKQVFRESYLSRIGKENREDSFFFL